jgi:hypothetical protein
MLKANGTGIAGGQSRLLAGLLSAAAFPELKRQGLKF